MIRSLAIVVGLLGPAVFTCSASAQLVRVGPWGGVRVRVPFAGVGVDVSPWGDTRVRAPFTRVEAPGDRYFYRGYRYPHGYGDYGDRWRPQYRYRYYSDSWGDVPPLGAPYHPHQGPLFVPPEEAAPPAYGRAGDAYRLPGEQTASDAVSADSPQRTAEALRSAAERLRRGLARRGEQGEIWLDYLQPERIIASIDGGEPPESLQPLLDNFEGVRNSRVGWVVGVEGFGETHRRLAEYIAAGGSGGRDAATQQRREAGGQETRELPPPAPEPPPQPSPEGAGSGDGDRENGPQSASADPPERFSL